MKPANTWIRIGRILGIIHIVAAVGVVILFIFVAFPWIDGAEPALIMVLAFFFMAALFTILLNIAWHREILGGILYILLGILPTLLLSGVKLYRFVQAGWVLLPCILTGLLFLIGGLQKRKLTAAGIF